MKKGTRDQRGQEGELPEVRLAAARLPAEQSEVAKPPQRKNAVTFHSLQGMSDEELNEFKPLVDMVVRELRRRMKKLY
ncbi:MAG TPA: hypothetical protein VFD58_17120 [Blastocatellia bacterium]|nr:hypothetical protein [Blastocatellia bacterium]